MKTRYHFKIYVISEPSMPYLSYLKIPDGIYGIHLAHHFGFRVSDVYYYPSYPTLVNSHSLGGRAYTGHPYFRWPTVQRRTGPTQGHGHSRGSARSARAGCRTPHLDRAGQGPKLDWENLDRVDYWYRNPITIKHIFYYLNWSDLYIFYWTRMSSMLIEIINLWIMYQAQKLHIPYYL